MKRFGAPCAEGYNDEVSFLDRGDLVVFFCSIAEKNTRACARARAVLGAILKKRKFCPELSRHSYFR